MYLNAEHPLVFFTFPFFHGVTDGDYLPAFEKGDLYSGDGGYAKIFNGRRAIFKPICNTSVTNTNSVRLERITPFSEVCIKVITLRVDPDEPESAYVDESHTILYEAYLHALLMKFLETHQLADMVPLLYEVVATTVTEEAPEDASDLEAIWMIMEFIHGETLEAYLKHKFVIGHLADNDRILLDIIFQLTHVLHLLQSSMGFNHRDMKLNNLIVRHHAPEDGWSRNILLPNGSIWNCHHDIVLIDFGFSCIACGTGFVNPRATLVGAGSYYYSEHDCMKHGRDLAQFLYSLHAAFPLSEYISRELFELLHIAVRAVRNNVSIDMWNGFTPEGIPLDQTYSLPRTVQFHDGVYAYLREGDTEVPGCKPAVLATALELFASRYT